jgi:hypothetical protein
MDDETKWAPLLAIAPELVGDFMWMFELELEDGTAVQAYKQRWTRRYLYLAASGCAFVEVHPHRFQEAEARICLESASSGDL